MNEWPSWQVVLAAVVLALVGVVVVLFGAGFVAWAILFGR